MGLLDRAIKRGISNAVGSAVEQGVRKAVAPRVEQAAASAVNSAAAQINNAVGTQQTAAPQTQAPAQSTMNQAEINQAANTLGSFFGSFQGAATNFANEAAKNMKICPACGEPASADQAFCPSCGAKLPEKTVAEGAVCTACGKQNTVGTKFCSGCGAKLPAAVEEEQAAEARNNTVMAEWDRLLPQYPKWAFGGNSMELDDQQADGYIRFNVNFNRDYNASGEVERYRQLLAQHGFHPAGQYADICHLYNRINGVCYHVDTEHCFDGGQDNVDIYFNIGEPNGGYDYVKPEPKKSTSIFDLFK